MKLKWIRNLWLGFIGLLLLFTVSTPTSASPQGSCSQPDADGIKVELDFAASPVKTGSNEVVVKLYDTDGQPIGGAEVTVVAAELLSAEATPHEEADSHSRQADVQLQADSGCSTETDAGGHESAPAAEHDMAGMDNHESAPAAEHDMAEMDNHESAPAAEHDMAGMDSHESAPAAEHDMAEMAVQTGPDQHGEGHSGGHGMAAPAELIAGPGPGEYQGQVSFNAEGRWLVKVNFMALGQSKEADFTLDVVKRGPNWYVLGGFLGVNTLVVAVAAVMKQKAAKA